MASRWLHLLTARPTAGTTASTISRSVVALYARHKFGLGYDAPWLALSVEGSHATTTAIRAARQQSPRASRRSGQAPYKRLSTPEQASSTIDVTTVTANRSVPGIPGNVFDLRGYGGYARVGYAVTATLYADARLAVRRGDVESTAQQSLPIFLVSSAIAEDRVFGKRRSVRVSTARHDMDRSSQREPCARRPFVAQSRLHGRAHVRGVWKPVSNPHRHAVFLLSVDEINPAADATYDACRACAPVRDRRCPEPRRSP